MPDHRFGFDTLCLHAGQIPDAQTGARALPIYQTTSFVFDDADHAASLFNLQTFGNVYSRISNPTVAALEERVAALEGGRAALAAATGMAAQMLVFLTLARNGDHIVAARSLYGGSYSQLAVTFEQFGIDTTFVDAGDPQAFRAALRPTTKCLYAETIGNPQLNVPDIEAIADIAHVAGVPLVIDNTLASPYLCRPIEHGADIVVHSLTKYLGGHGTTMSHYLIAQLATKRNVEVRFRSQVVRVEGTDHLEAIVVENRDSGEQQRHETDALFVFIGADAETAWLPSELIRDVRGYVCTGRDVLDLVAARQGTWPLARDPYLLETSVPGIFAAGDVRHGSIKRVASGVGEGSMAIAFIHQYLAERSAAATGMSSVRAA